MLDVALVRQPVGLGVFSNPVADTEDRMTLGDVVEGDE